MGGAVRRRLGAARRRRRVGDSLTPRPGRALNFFGVPADPAAAETLVAHATEAALAAGADEAGFFAPTDTSADDPAVAAIVAPLRASGWRLLVERRHYEFAPGARTSLPTSPCRSPSSSSPIPPTRGWPRATARSCATPWTPTMRRPLTGSASTRAAARRWPSCSRATRSIASTWPSTPRENRSASCPGWPGPNGRGFILFVGVAHDHRGHGYGRQLLAWQTRRLLEGGATVLIADTDNQNVPMAKAFAEVGWPQTETRLYSVR